MDYLHRNIFGKKILFWSSNPFRAEPYLNKSSTDHCNASQDLLSSDIQTTVWFKDIESKKNWKKKNVGGLPQAWKFSGHQWPY